jgi:hypothetical protein
LRVQHIASSLALQLEVPVKITPDVVISRQEYLECQHGRPLHFQATIQNADGTTQTRMLALRASPFMGVK